MKLGKGETYETVEYSDNFEGIEITDLTIYQLKKKAITCFKFAKENELIKLLTYIAKLHIEDGIDYNIYDSTNLTEKIKEMIDKLTNKELIITKSFGFYNCHNYEDLSLFGKCVILQEEIMAQSLYSINQTIDKYEYTNGKHQAPYLEIAGQNNNFEMCKLLFNCGYTGKYILNEKSLINTIVENDNFDMLEWFHRYIQTIDITNASSDVVIPLALKNHNEKMIALLLTYKHKITDRHILTCLHTLNTKNFADCKQTLDIILKINRLPKDLFFEIVSDNTKFVNWGIQNGYKYNKQVYRNAFKRYDKLTIPILSSIFNSDIKKEELSDVLKERNVLYDLSKCNMTLCKWISLKGIVISSQILSFVTSDKEKFIYLVEECKIPITHDTLRETVMSIKSLSVFVYITTHTELLKNCKFDLIQDAIDNNNIEIVEILLRYNYKYPIRPINLNKDSLIKFVKKHRTHKDKKCIIM